MHLASTHNSHQLLREYFHLCKSGAADKTQTALGTMELFYEWHLDNKNTCTGWPCSSSRGRMTLRGDSSGPRLNLCKMWWTIRNFVVCVLCQNLQLKDCHRLNPSAPGKIKSCLSKVICWHGASGIRPLTYSLFSFFHVFLPTKMNETTKQKNTTLEY